MADTRAFEVSIKVVGVGGAGGNALQRMAAGGVEGTDLLALNTDVQALGGLKRVHSFAIGPRTTGGAGSGGRPETGRKAIKESREQVSQLLERADMVFITAGMGGGTGSGAASVVGDIARRQGALTVGVVTMPFSFEGPERMETARAGLLRLQQKVDTLIVVENDRLLPAVSGRLSLDKAFALADDALLKGVRGIADIIAVPGLINVDFADVKAVMTNGGPSFMSIGEGKGRSASRDAAEAALSNPLFDAPLAGATGILLNVKGGNDLSLGQVTEIAKTVRRAASPDANVVFGVVQQRSLKRRVSVTVVATGVGKQAGPGDRVEAATPSGAETRPEQLLMPHAAAPNGHRPAALNV